MHFRPAPLPDEFVSGYLGMILRRNGYLYESDAVKVLRNWAGVTNGWEAPKVLLLAKVAEMEPSAFIRGHTTLSLQRGITVNNNEFEHGSKGSYPILRKWAMHSGRPGAYLCHQCVAEDLDFHGYSYWRCDQQMAGRYWCLKHGNHLHFLDDEGAYLSSPSFCLDHAKPILSDWVNEAKENSVVKRFNTICTYVLDRRKSFEAQDIKNILRVRARQLGLQLSRVGTPGPLLSDFAINMIGRQWLTAVFPSMEKKLEGEQSMALDWVLFLDRAASSLAYLIAAALLYETAEEALNSFVNGEKDARANGRVSVQHSDDIDPLISAYVRSEGSYSITAQVLSRNMDQVGNNLREAGLPNLKPHENQNIRRALVAFFCEKRSVHESAVLGNIKASVLEAMLRAAGLNLNRVLLSMDKKAA